MGCTPTGQYMTEEEMPDLTDLGLTVVSPIETTEPRFFSGFLLGPLLSSDLLCWDDVIARISRGIVPKGRGIVPKMERAVGKNGSATRPVVTVYMPGANFDDAVPIRNSPQDPVILVHIEEDSLDVTQDAMDAFIEFYERELTHSELITYLEMIG